MKKLLLFISVSIVFFSCEKTENCTSSINTIETLNIEITSSTSIAEDNASLMELFEKIETLTESEICSDANNWKFTAYGSKACGGPIGYIAYSKCINSADFLNKVSVFSELQSQYNSKYGVISPCDVPPQPKSVECVNDKPNLVY